MSPSSAKTLTTRRPARPGITRQRSLKAPQLTGYLAGVVGSAALLGGAGSKAAVTSVSFGFGSVLDITSGRNYTTSITPDFGTIPMWVSYMPGMDGMPAENIFRIGEKLSQFGHFYQQGAGTYGGLGKGLPTFLANGTVVGGGGNGALGMAYFASSNADRDLPSDQLHKNLGFETTTGNWGWANVSWDATAKALTFNSAYVESVAGNTITVS